MPKLRINAGGPNAQALELKPGINRLGRNPDNDFQVIDASVSGNHCEMRVSDICTLVRDLGSTNGTFIDRKQIVEGVIQSGQLLHVGKVEMVFEAGEVNLSIPELSRPDVPIATILPDGTQACLNHPDVQATRKCVNCGNHYCDACVHTLRIAGGVPKIFCPACSGPCESLAWAIKKPKQKSFFGVLGDTLKIPFRK